MTDYSLTGHMQSVVDRFAGDLHTCLPARIIGIDYKTQKATVQPLIKMRYTDAGSNPEGLVDMSSIPSVPLIFPSSKFATMTFPVKAGDLVLLVFSQRSVDTFKYSDGSAPVDPNDYRMHDYTDAFAICGLSTFATALGIHEEDTVIRMNAGQSNESKLSFKPNGDVVFDTTTKFIVNATNEVTVNTQVANINASSSVKIDSPQTTITGELRVDHGISVGNDVSTDAGITLKTHKHIANLAKPTSAGIP